MIREVSNHQNTITYEVSVDRSNEKGVFVAREMLSTLHHAVEHVRPWWKIWVQRSHPSFRFEMIAIGGQIRFFLSAEREFASFLSGQLYAHYSDIELIEVDHPIKKHTSFRTKEIKIAHHSLETIKLYVNLKDRTEKESVDPLSSVTSALAKVPRDQIGACIIDFAPIHDYIWRDGSRHHIWHSPLIPDSFRMHVLHFWAWIGWLFLPISWSMRLLRFLSQSTNTDDHGHEGHEKKEKIETKTEGFGYSVRIQIVKDVREAMTDELILKEISGSMNIFANPGWNSFVMKRTHLTKNYPHFSKPPKSSMILSTTELAGMIHMPTLYVKTPGIRWVTTRKFEPPHNLPNTDAPNTPIGMANYRGQLEGFGLKPIDRARHVYIIGKTGMGKSTLLENMIYTDILNGRWVAVIDPHGDLVETILANIPKSRTNDIVLFDPADQEYPIAFNMLDNPHPELRPIVAGWLVSIFKKMFAESWGPRLEYILRNTILTLLLIPDTTLISVPLMLTHEAYRKKVVAKIDDPILVQFWNEEFAKMSPSMQSESINPILNKVGQFLSSPILRNILGQPKNPFSLRWIMDNGKIFLVNLSKGRIGEDASALLWAMMVTKFQIEAMTRADIPEGERRDFGLYVDEFQNFATDSFATILSEARKYKLSLTMANQYVEQMAETVQGAVFGNVGSLIAFQVGYHDAVTFAEVFGGEDIITPQDLTNLKKYDIYTKLLIEWMPSPVFSATTYAPLRERIDVPPQQARDVLLKVSREKYTKKKDFVEKKIFDSVTKIREDEKKHRAEQEAYKEGLKVKKEALKKQKSLE
jgi:hypothetical protein